MGLSEKMRWILEAPTRIDTEYDSSKSKPKTAFRAFLQDNGFPYRKMHFPAEKAALRGTWQETGGNCSRVSGLRNQERWPTFTRGTGRRIQRTTEVIPCRGIVTPGGLKTPLLPESDLSRYAKTHGCKGCARGTAQHFLHSFPSYGPSVVQSYQSSNANPRIVASFAVALRQRFRIAKVSPRYRPSP